MDIVARNDIPNIRTRVTQTSPAKHQAESGGKIPRRKPVYPISAERELARAFIDVARVLTDRAPGYMGRLMAIYDAWAAQNIRADADETVESILDEFEEDVMSKIDMTKLIRKVTRSGKVARGTSIRDWKALVDDGAGVAISEPFYMETMEDLMNKWVADSVSYITSLPRDTLAKVHEIIMWGYNTNQPRVNIYRRMEHEIGMTRKHAKAIAQDQMGTLNCRMTQYEHESLGVTHYVWTARHDTKVRPCHRELNHKIFSWNNPPAMWYPTISKGIIYTGRYCHPGEDYGCRCTAKPVLDVEKVQEMATQQMFAERSV